MKDLIILGNGMAGMTAALYAKRANLDFDIIGKDSYDFGQIGNAILVENYPCSESKSGFDLAMSLHDQLEANDIEIKEHTVVDIYKYLDNTYSVICEDGTVYDTKTIIYALGAKHRELNCEIEQGIVIHHCALCDGPLYKDKRVAVIGGGDVAFTQAEYLSKICKEVHIIMCDDNITAAPSTAERVKKIKNVRIDFNCPVVKICNKNFGQDESYWIWCQGVRGPIFAEGVFVSIGMIPNTSILHFINLTENGYIPADETGVTDCPGFFAAGDVRTKKVRQSVTAASDGANAVQSVIDYLKNESLIRMGF